MDGNVRQYCVDKFEEIRSESNKNDESIKKELRVIRKKIFNGMNTAILSNQSAIQEIKEMITLHLNQHEAGAARARAFEDWQREQAEEEEKRRQLEEEKKDRRNKKIVVTVSTSCTAAGILLGYLKFFAG